MNAVTTTTPVAKLPDASNARCEDCDRRAEYIVLTEGDDGPTYCAVHFALTAARVSGILP